MRTVIALAAAGAIAPAAHAQIDSIRLGVLQHNVCVIDCEHADKESGPNIDGEVRFKSPDFLAWAGAPHPYAMASVNTRGNTSFGGVGLEWDFDLAPGWRVEPGFGYVLHDGNIDNPFPNGTPESAAFFRDNVLLGSRDLFRTSLALTWDISETFAVQGLFEHLSHGNILSHGHNQSLNELGVRAVWKLK